MALGDNDQRGLQVVDQYDQDSPLFFPVENLRLDELESRDNQLYNMLTANFRVTPQDPVDPVEVVVTAALGFDPNTGEPKDFVGAAVVLTAPGGGDERFDLLMYNGKTNVIEVLEGVEAGSATRPNAPSDERVPLAYVLVRDGSDIDAAQITEARQFSLFSDGSIDSISATFSSGHLSGTPERTTADISHIALRDSNLFSPITTRNIFLSGLSLDADIDTLITGGVESGRLSALPGDGDYIYMAVVVRDPAADITALILYEEDSFASDSVAVAQAGTDASRTYTHFRRVGACSVNVSGGGAVAALRTMIGYNGRMNYKAQQVIHTSDVSSGGTEIALAGLVSNDSISVYIGTSNGGDNNTGTHTITARVRNSTGVDWGVDATGDKVIHQTTQQEAQGGSDHIELPALPDSTSNKILFALDTLGSTVFISIKVDGFAIPV